VQEANVTQEYEKGLPETCEPIRASNKQNNQKGIS